MSLLTYESCYETWHQLEYEAISLSYPGNLTEENIHIVMECCDEVYDSYKDSNYSKPMVWIGIYIAAASLFCVLAMMADLLHGFRNRKFWFPCEYFRLNAASITIIAIAMKLPVDLNTPMRSKPDLLVKLGSLVFMSTMMAHLMPSLASMNKMELLANGTGLVILVITLIVNILIQLETGLFEYLFLYVWTNHRLIPDFLCVWLGGVVCSLIILISAALAVPTVKQILEFKYQVAHTTALNDKHPKHTNSNVKELMQHVRRHWVMARTSNLQFVMANTPLCCAVSVISVFVSAVHITEVSYTVKYGGYKNYVSAYNRSMLLILITQSIGIVIGNIAPLFRCFAALGFKLSFKWTINHINIFKIEKYWTQKLSMWKESHLTFPSRGRILRLLVHNLKNLILSICIGLQKVIVMLCKMIGLIPVILVLVMYSLSRVKSVKAMIPSMLIAKTRHNTVHENDTDTDICNYVLQLQDETKLAKHTVKRISNSLNRSMQKAEKKHKPNNLMKLLQKSTGFKGVESFDSDQVQPLPSVELCCPNRV